LHKLAEAIGISRRWWDVDGAGQTVADGSLAAIAEALGYPAQNSVDIAHSLARADQEAREIPPMIVTEAGKSTPLPAALMDAELTDESGETVGLRTDSWSLPPIAMPGYYTLAIAGRQIALAVAPARCPAVSDFKAGKIWGPAVQIPALRGAETRPFGNFAELDEAARLFAARGADAVAINPVHALFPGNGEDFSPYSPSSRMFLNTAMGDPGLLGLPPLPAREGASLIDWPAALPQRMMDLRTIFDGLSPEMCRAIEAENAPYGKDLQRQALFDALDARFRADGAKGWRQWPQNFRDPASPNVAGFASERREDVEFHLFAQWLARESLKKVQNNARQSGMAIGLIGDLAVGVHTGGADTWSMREFMLDGLTIGAPPDPLGPHGQNWMLSGFSPQGLRNAAYAPWIATIRSALSVAGGLRIDHAFGLSRLWLVPEGETSSSGAYLNYPFMDLMRLLALEAFRANALIIAEDLGTMPPGFAEPMADKQMLGMRVLWFERAADEGFIGSQDYPPRSVAMTGTHDTPTVAGWWSGRDIEWAEQLGRLPQGTTAAEAELRRSWDRGLLWSTLTHDKAPRPGPDDPEPVVEAALRHIGSSASDVAIAPLEDLLADREQPNLPGTISEHPNWQRRLPHDLAILLDTPATAMRIRTLDEARETSAASPPDIAPVRR
jgi:4-alpha-glucanotransferase